MHQHMLDPTSAQHLQIAAHALEAGDANRAERSLAGLRAAYPHHHEVLRLQAILYDMRGMTREALVTMHEALGLRPQDAVYHNTMAALLSKACDYDSAIAELHRACELDPGFVMGWYNLGIALTLCARFDEAIAAFRRTVQLEPRHAAARARLADALRNSGDTASAEAEYRQLLREQPSAGVAWQGLADLKTVSFTQAEIIRMRDALASREAGDEDRIATGFALAKALDGRGDYPEALAALADAKAIARRRQTWDAAAFSRTVTALHAAFSPPPKGSSAPGLGREVIFIVGLPRSGTTLVEQILASHPQVEGTGELSDLRSVLVEESRRRNQPYPDWVRNAQPEDWERVGRAYLQRTERWRQMRPMFTDKLPNNWMFVGAIMAMLPSAHVVCCRRDPLETCFSSYYLYRVRNDYSNTFADIAHFWRDYDRSVRLWLAHYPGQVYEHKYEELLSQPDAAVKRLLEFCGLPWDARCLQFHENRREVHTPSATQVRQPLHRDTARGPRYGSLLDPLRAELGLPPYAVKPSTHRTGDTGEPQAPRW